MLGLLTGNGFEIVDDETEAEAIVVNTCCFINDAKEESVNTILEMAEYKKNREAVKSWLSQDVWHSVIRMRSLRKYRK